MDNRDNGPRRFGRAVLKTSWLAACVIAGLSASGCSGPATLASLGGSVLGGTLGGAQTRTIGGGAVLGALYGGGLAAAGGVTACAIDPCGGPETFAEAPMGATAALSAISGAVIGFIVGAVVGGVMPDDPREDERASLGEGASGARLEPARAVSLGPRLQQDPDLDDALFGHRLTRDSPTSPY